MRKTHFIFHVLSLAIANTVHATALPEKPCKEAQPLRITFKHIEGNGVGYSHGYTTAEGFFAPINHLDSFLPFLDVRAHVFNNGLPAVNAGLGLRYASTSRIWGINGYYDYRKTNRVNYNQVGAGLETLGKGWDFRINGYLPIWKTKSSYFGSAFDHFKGNNMILSRKFEFAFNQVNAEIGTSAIKMHGSPTYLAAGPYYLSGYGKTTWGGKARLAVDLFEYFQIQGIASYDSIFKGIVQGQASLNIPLGPRKEPKPLKGRTTKKQCQINTMLMQPVDRNEIIPISKKKTQTVAIDPITGLPYQFIFVNNLSTVSLGTYENPYTSTAEAQQNSAPYDIIYVYPGDNTTRDYNTGFTMKLGQKLLGSGIAYNFAVEQNSSDVVITLPPQSTTYPHLSLEFDPGVGHLVAIIYLADDCELAGIDIGSLTEFSGRKMCAVLGGDVSMDPSTILGITNTYIHQNNIHGAFTSGGIFLHNCQGNLIIQNNTIPDLVANAAIDLFNNVSNLPINTTITGNVLENIEGALVSPSGFGIRIYNTEGVTVSTQTALIAKNTINTCSAHGIALINKGSNALPTTTGYQSFTVLSNVINSATDNGVYVFNSGVVDVQRQIALIKENTINVTADGRGALVENNGSNVNIDFQYIDMTGNVAINTYLDGFSLINFNTVNILNQEAKINVNTVFAPTTEGISFISSFNIAATNQNINLSFNEIQNCGHSGLFIQNSGTSVNPACITAKTNFIDTSASHGIQVDTLLSSKMNLALEGNTITNTALSSSMLLTSENSSKICTQITNNTMDKLLTFEQLNSSQLLVEPLIHNTSSGVTGSYTPVPAHTCDCH